MSGCVLPPLLIWASFINVLGCHSLFLPQDMDPPHPFPKEIPHNEKLLSLKYEVGLLPLCSRAMQPLALYPLPSPTPPPAARHEPGTLGQWSVLSLLSWSAELGL